MVGSVISGQFASRVTLLREKVPSFEEYPFALPFVRSLEILDLHEKITIFVGENGSGKSTLLEAIAVALDSTQRVVRRTSSSQRPVALEPFRLPLYRQGLQEAQGRLLPACRELLQRCNRDRAVGRRTRRPACHRGLWREFAARAVPWRVLPLPPHGQVPW